MRAVTRKEFLQLRRDTGTLRIIFAMPLIMMFLFGYAVNTDVERVPTAALVQDSSARARDLLQRFEQSTFFRIEQYARSLAEVESLIQRGHVKVAVVIPPDYAARLDRGESSPVQVLIDGSDPLVSRQALATSQIIAQLSSTEVILQRLSRAGAPGLAAAPIDLRPRVWYNPNMESVKFNMPGLVGVVLANITIILTSMALVRERERGTIEQLLVSPVQPAELILGKLVPYACIAAVDAVIVMLVSMFLFGMEIAGSLWLLGVSAFAFLLGTLGQGLFISSMAQNQLQALQLSNLFVMPAIFLSGFMFPRETMPLVLQLAGYAVPLTYFLQVLRGIILKGNGWVELWPQIVGLAVFGVLILRLAMVRLRRRLD